MLTTIRELLTSGDLARQLKSVSITELMEIHFNAHAQHDSLSRLVETVDAEMARRERQRHV